MAPSSLLCSANPMCGFLSQPPKRSPGSSYLAEHAYQRSRLRGCVLHIWRRGKVPLTALFSPQRARMGGRKHRMVLALNRSVWLLCVSLPKGLLCVWLLYLEAHFQAHSMPPPCRLAGPGTVESLPRHLLGWGAVFACVIAVGVTRTFLSRAALHAAPLAFVKAIN